MNKISYIILVVLMALTTVSFAGPRGKILTKAVTPNTLSQFTTNSISNGLSTVAKGTYSYLAPSNIGDTSLITNVTWSFVTRPTGSNATITNLANQWATFIADTNGTYVVNMHIVTSTGSHDTTINITSSYYTGVGNFDGVAAQWPQCMSCHGSYVDVAQFSAIFNSWQNTPHATLFKTEINIPVSAGGHYTSSCFPCHTIGSDNHTVVNNNGFDDVAKQVGFVWDPNSANVHSWDTLKAKYPSLVNHATIGCENCHGAGREHGTTGNTSKIAISLDAGLCQSCHDAPWRHDVGTMWNFSGHSTAVFENSATQGTTLNSCQRCHISQAFVDFTKGVTTNTTGWTTANGDYHISCQTCHDPHGNTNAHELRKEPIASDTLGNGYNYGNFGGMGNICINCHKARKNSVTIMTTAVNSTWGPHHSTQADNILGLNGAQFGTQPFVSGDHKYAIANICVDCHMAATTDTGTVTRDQVGGHSWNLHYAATNYDHTVACVNCHGPKTSFSQFQASMDYDGNGTVEDVQTEVKGCLTKIASLLPHNPDGTFIYANITTLTQKQAYWNYQLIANDGSYGMHNAKFAFDVLTKSISALTGITPVELLSFDAAVASNSAKLTWMTATETNNKGFDIETLNGKTWTSIAFIPGRGTTTDISNYSYSDKLSANGSYTYRLKQIDFNGTASYSKEVAVDFKGGPTSYSLSQNYPNPFNPSTTIKFTLPFDSNVKLTIYNITGQIVKVLVNAVQSAGTHEVNFNFNESGFNISSGIYFYSIEARATNNNGSFRETKKMVLLK
jgi:hypothetical protein